MNLPEALEYVPRLPEPIETVLAYLSLALIFGLLVQRIWKVWSWLLRPLAVRWRRWLSRYYVENALKSLTKNGMEVPLSGERYRVKIRWAESEGVDVLLDKGVLIVNMPYVEELEHVIAKALLLASPYLVSPYLAAVFGEKLARALTVNIAYRHASRDLRVLMHLDNLVNGLTASDDEIRDVVELVKRADQASYYIHIFLPEISRALQDFAVAELDRETFRREALELLRLLANLDEVDVPYLCGSYLRFVVVRAGRLEKVMLDMWEPYVGFVEGVRAKCRDLWKIYVVSAGGDIRRKVAYELVSFMEKKTGAKLVRAGFYTALMFRGRPKVPAYVAELVLAPSGG
ncbi:MAG: hypothetical protein ACO2PN_01840 [Pyrobaculum sp.]|jgi:hypothetical protein